MNFQTKTAIKSNKSNDNLWFDLETTGLGKGSSGNLFEKPV
jgi:uncharacterized protein YprB with RNaseH-like and TPR domain